MAKKSKYQQAAEVMRKVPPGEFVDADWIAEQINHPRTNVVQIMGYLRQKGQIIAINPSGRSGGARLYRLNRMPLIEKALISNQWTTEGMSCLA